MDDQKLEQRVTLRAACEEFEQTNTNIVAAAVVEPSIDESVISNVIESHPVAFGKFERGEELSTGALGKVFSARNTLSEGSFAMKLLSSAYCREGEESAQLIERLRAVSLISNPHLAAYYDCGVGPDKSIYLVSDLLNARSLTGFTTFDPELQTARFLDIVRQICQALKNLHQQNFVHGDLKPSNIFLMNAENGLDFIKLNDYGIASHFNEEQRAELLRNTRTGEQFANYMSPEQCLGYSIDARSDIYSLGLVMYEILTGTPLCTAQTQMLAVMKQLNVTPRLIREQNKSVPHSIEKIVMKCLEKNRASRYFSIADLELDLDLAAAEVPDLKALSSDTPSDSFAFAAAPHLASAEKNPQEQRVKMALSAVICAGVLACIGVATLNAFSDRGFGPRWPSRHQWNPIGNHAPQFNPYSSETFERRADSAISIAISPERAAMRNDLYRQGNTDISERELLHARYLQDRALEVFPREHPGAMDPETVQQLASMQQKYGELLSCARYSDDGGMNNRKAFYDSFEAGKVGNLYLQPSWQGLSASGTLTPDYEGAKRSFDQARATLGNNLDARNIDLLWDSCFTEFQLGHDAAAIELQKKLIDVYSKEDIQNKGSLIISHANLGRMYLRMGNAGKAVHEFKKAVEIDKKTYPMGNGDYSDQVRADLAFGYLNEGKWDVALKIARANLKLMDNHMLIDSELALTDLKDFNQAIQLESLRQLGRIDEADKLEFQRFKEAQQTANIP